MIVRIGRPKPAPEELGQLLGRKVAEMVAHPDGVVELEVEGVTDLTDAQKQQLAERFNVYRSNIAIDSAQ